MASEWFDRVTGSNDYERQSYRDSYNGGRANGDWTGGVNARLDRERAENNGFTVSGSSSQASAAEARSWQDRNEVAELTATYEHLVSKGKTKQAYAVAQALARFDTPTVRPTGPGVASVTPPLVNVVTSGPGGHGAGKAPDGVTQTSGPGILAQKPATASVGPSAATVVKVPAAVQGSGPGIQLPMDEPSLLIPLYAGGRRLSIDRGWSNAADVEDRLGEGEFMSPSWFMNWGIAGADTWANVKDMHTETVKRVGPIRGGNGWSTLSNAFEQQDKRLSQGLHRAFNTGVAVPGGGF